MEQFSRYKTKLYEIMHPKEVNDHQRSSIPRNVLANWLVYRILSPGGARGGGGLIFSGLLEVEGGGVIREGLI